MAQMGMYGILQACISSSSRVAKARARQRCMRAASTELFGDVCGTAAGHGHLQYRERRALSWQCRPSVTTRRLWMDIE